MRGYNHDHNPHGKHSQLSINGQTFPSCPGFCGTGKKGSNLRIILFYFNKIFYNSQIKILTNLQIIPFLRNGISIIFLDLRASFGFTYSSSR